MPTLKQYLADSTLLRSDAFVTSVGTVDGRCCVRLDRTIFHPQGGGQQSDRGRIGGVEVTHVAHADNGEVNHFLDSGDGVAVGDHVELLVDPVQRELAAWNHSAGHLIAAVAECRFPTLRAISGHHWPGEARVEFQTTGDVPQDLREALYDDIAAAQSADLPFSVTGDPYTDRAIRIGSFLPVPCGGTHVQRASQIAVITIEKIRSKHGKLRVSYSVSAR